MMQGEWSCISLRDLTLCTRWENQRERYFWPLPLLSNKACNENLRTESCINFKIFAFRLIVNLHVYTYSFMAVQEGMISAYLLLLQWSVFFFWGKPCWNSWGKFFHFLFNNLWDEICLIICPLIVSGIVITDETGNDWGG